MGDTNQQESMAIVGGGVTGIIAAIELAKTGCFQVTIFEKENQLGGLSSYYKWQDVICDRFYHVILSTDTNMLEFIRELDLESEFFWHKAKSGFYGEEKLVSFSSTIDFIRFPFLSLWQKFRMGLGILYSTKIRSPLRLDRIYARQWLTKIFGQQVYENIWEPLLRSKLGDAKDRTSAAFIWATITRLYGTRSFASNCNKMGHVRGGYHTILSAAQRKLSELNVKIMTNALVLKVEFKSNFNFPEKSRNANCYRSNHGYKQIVLATSMGNFKFDRLLFTVPCPKVLQTLDNVNNHPYWQQLQDVEYLGIACVLLILNRKLSPYYVINLLNKNLPFTGIIESTNIVSPHDLGSKHLVYLPKYMTKNDPMNILEDDQIINLFVDKLKTVFPDLRNEEILHIKIFREKYVQPIQELNFLDRNIGFRTPLPNVYLTNASMTYSSTPNNNAAISLTRKAIGAIIADSMKKV